MNIEVVVPDRLPQVAAAHIADLLSDAVAARGTASLAVSGGRTPATMFAALATAPMPWQHVHLLQVDERLAPDGDPARNLTHLTEDLLELLPMRPAGIHAMPAAAALAADGAAETAAATYASVLTDVAGSPPIIDVVHLGLGDDGHTASLVPGDPVLEVTDRAVAVTGPYEGHRRMTLTYPVLAAGRHLVWLVAGDTKADALHRLLAGDTSIPAGRLPHERATVFADPPAASAV